MKNNSVNELYYDAEYTRKVRTSDFAVSADSLDVLWSNNYIGYMNIHDAVMASYALGIDGRPTVDWKKNADGSYIQTTTSYTLNGNTVFALFVYNDKSSVYEKALR